MAEEDSMQTQTPGEVEVIEDKKKSKKKSLTKKVLGLTKKVLGKTLFAKSPKQKLPKKSKVFGTKAVPPTFTQEQNIMRSLFGGGGKVMTNFDGRSLPRIDRTLTTGGGILKSGDRERETMNLMASGKPSMFFGGQRRGRI